MNLKENKMALEKTTKQILLIVSALVLVTTTTVCIVKRDAIANFFRPKIKQENLINSPTETSVNSSEGRTSSHTNNEPSEEKFVTLKEKEYKQISEECDKILELLKKDEPQKEKSVTLKEEYKKICEEYDRTDKLLQQAEVLETKASSDVTAFRFKNAIMLSHMPQKSPEEKAAYIKKEEEVLRVLFELRETRDRAMHYCLCLKKSLDAKERRLGEIEEILDEISPGWNDDLEQG